MAAEVPNDELRLYLCRAVRDTSGLPLIARSKKPGHFPNTAHGKRLAQHCLHAGYLAPVVNSSDGRSGGDLYVLSDAGKNLLLEAAQPADLLEKLLAAILDRKRELAALRDDARMCEARLAEIAQRVEATLPTTFAIRVNFGPIGEAHSASLPGGPRLSEVDDLAGVILKCLAAWQDDNPSTDCPLPELFHQLQRLRPAYSIGQFHDELRRLQHGRVLRLQPWTGPLTEMPLPAFALLVGHAVMYYASAYTRDSEVNDKPTACALSAVG